MEISHLESRANAGHDIGLDNYSLRALVGYVRQLESDVDKLANTEPGPLAEGYADTLDVEIPQEEMGRMIRELSSPELKIMLYVYSRPEGWLFKNHEIMEYTGLSERSVKTNKNSLKKKKYITVKGT